MVTGHCACASNQSKRHSSVIGSHLNQVFRIKLYSLIAILFFSDLHFPSVLRILILEFPVSASILISKAVGHAINHLFKPLIIQAHKSIKFKIIPELH